MTAPTVLTRRPAAPTHRPPVFDAASQGGYTVALAVDDGQVRAAQRLRHEVFGAEFGARLPGADNGLDSDRFDAHCDHLLVTEKATGAVVGTYRLLPPHGARAAEGRYADAEFDLAPHASLHNDLVRWGVRASTRTIGTVR